VSTFPCRRHVDIGNRVAPDMDTLTHHLITIEPRASGNHCLANHPKCSPRDFRPYRAPVANVNLDDPFP
jgi:hypothetical protein